MLGYVFWHAPAEGVDAAHYENALSAFHRSLAHSPPFGFEGSAAFRVGASPWEAFRTATAPPGPGASGWYEDWYLVADFSALGVLNEAAVGRGHRSLHDRAAKGLGSATAGIYRLLEGGPVSGASIGECRHATWIEPSGSTNAAEMGALLGDGMDPSSASVWRRQLVLGPAPEFCVLSREQPAGVASTRLAPRWSARTLPREAVFGA